MHPTRPLFATGALAGLGLLLSACTNAPPALVPPPGSSAQFQDGYADGCWDGYRDAGRDPISPYAHVDAARFQTVPDYRAGFQLAYRACFEDEKRHPHTHPDGGVHP